MQREEENEPMRTNEIFHEIALLLEREEFLTHSERVRFLEVLRQEMTS